MTESTLFDLIYTGFPLLGHMELDVDALASHKAVTPRALANIEMISRCAAPVLVQRSIHLDKARAVSNLLKLAFMHSEIRLAGTPTWLSPAGLAMVERRINERRGGALTRRLRNRSYDTLADRRSASDRREIAKPS